MATDAELKQELAAILLEKPVSKDAHEVTHRFFMRLQRLIARERLEARIDTAEKCIRRMFDKDAMTEYVESLDRELAALDAGKRIPKYDDHPGHLGNVDD